MRKIDSTCASRSRLFGIIPISPESFRARPCSPVRDKTIALALKAHSSHSPIAAR